MGEEQDPGRGPWKRDFWVEWEGRGITLMPSNLNFSGVQGGKQAQAGLRVLAQPLTSHTIRSLNFLDFFIHLKHEEDGPGDC